MALSTPCFLISAICFLFCFVSFRPSPFAFLLSSCSFLFSSFSFRLSSFLFRLYFFFCLVSAVFFASFLLPAFFLARPKRKHLSLREENPHFDAKRKFRVRRNRTGGFYGATNSIFGAIVTSESVVSLPQNGGRYEECATSCQRVFAEITLRGKSQTSALHCPHFDLKLTLN